MITSKRIKEGSKRKEINIEISSPDFSKNRQYEEFKTFPKKKEESKRRSFCEKPLRSSPFHVNKRRKSCFVMLNINENEKNKKRKSPLQIGKRMSEEKIEKETGEFEKNINIQSVFVDYINSDYSDSDKISNKGLLKNKFIRFLWSKNCFIIQRIWSVQFVFLVFIVGIVLFACLLVYFVNYYIWIYSVEKQIKKRNEIGVNLFDNYIWSMFQVTKEINYRTWMGLMHKLDDNPSLDFSKQTDESDYAIIKSNFDVVNSQPSSRFTSKTICSNYAYSDGGGIYTLKHFNSRRSNSPVSPFNIYKTEKEGDGLALIRFDLFNRDDINNLTNSRSDFKLDNWDMKTWEWYKEGMEVAQSELKNSESLSETVYWSRFTLFIADPHIFTYKPLIWNSTIHGIVMSAFHYENLVQNLVDFSEMVIIFNDEGSYICSSFKDVEFYNSSTSDRILFHEHPNKMIQGFGEYFYQTYQGNYSIIESKIDLKRVNIVGKDYIITIRKWIGNDNGLKLYLLMIFDYSELYRDVNSSKLLCIIITIVLSFFLVFISSIIAFLFSKTLSYATFSVISLAKLLDPRAKKRCEGIVFSDLCGLYEFRNMKKAIKKLECGLDNYKKFLPKEILLYLGDDWKPRIELEKRNVSIIFIDIVNFTSITEKIDETKLILFLTTFFTITEESISQNGGIVDKFIGDCTMGSFNTLENVPTHRLDCVYSALNVIKNIEINSKNFVASAIPKLEVRIGINSGQGCIGFIGSKNKLSYTVLGDVVNTSSRLESLNKQYGTKILVGNETYEEIKDDISCVYVDSICLRGKEVKLNVYTVLTDENQKCKMEDYFCRMNICV